MISRWVSARPELTVLVSRIGLSPVTVTDSVTVTGSVSAHAALASVQAR
jgi:hypothetical protein